MIPVQLQQMILSGKARVRTYVAGGGQKTILSVPDDHYIVIYRFSHFPYMPGADENAVSQWMERWTTQMRIFSDKSDNHFVIRNNFSVGLDIAPSTPVLVPGQPYQEDCFLLHESDVSFTFSLGTKIAPTLIAVTPAEAPAKPPFVDYGKDGLYGGTGAPIAVTQIAGTFAGAEYRPMGEFVAPTGGLPSSADQLNFPVTGILAITSADLAETVLSYPIVNVQYVMIEGNPTDKKPTTS